ncbi:MAG: efflux RND transporter permease subunit, partial [Cytophagales bacterium]|nr:efflux RND transporter permease subunit [Cytophagales bacterium]
LTTVFFLDESQRLMLADFCYVILVNLGVSLLVSLLLIPAMLDRLPLPRPSQRRSVRGQRRLVRGYERYKGFLYWMRLRRKWIIVLLVLAFGLPVFEMPKHWEAREGWSTKTYWYHEAYNAVFGSDLYSETLRPYVDKALGGALRLFLKETKHKNLSSARKRTELSVTGDMYEGVTLEKTNEIFRRIERFLAAFPEIEQFETSIPSASEANVTVLFKPEYELGSFPHTLKAKVQSLAVDMGVGDWKISGVGRGFDNSLYEGKVNSRVTFYSYNWEQTREYAKEFIERIKKVQRVDQKTIHLDGMANRSNKIQREYVLRLNRERMKQSDVGTGRLLSELRKLSENKAQVMSLQNGEYTEEVNLRRVNRKIPDQWELQQGALSMGDMRMARLEGMGRMTRNRVSRQINKENMEYTMVVEFDFIGSDGQRHVLMEPIIKKMANELPIGYRLEQESFQWGSWQKDGKKDNRLYILLLILAIIYGICAIVFESLRQPLWVLAMIPISFIGVFLVFYGLSVPFSPGGYASLLLLSGLAVNASLYIINDLNG